MFTGIIEELGEVKKISRAGRCTSIAIKSATAKDGTKIGDSIAVNGACLTVAKQERELLFFDVMPETLKLTNLSKLRIGEKVNLERALKFGDRVSGHFVSGHIDCSGTIRRKAYLENNLCFEIAVPVKFIHFIVTKGSIAVDGISLTAVDVKKDSFTIYIIPHTSKLTTLGFREPGDNVNIELDMLSKYVKEHNKGSNP